MSRSTTVGLALVMLVTSACGGDGEWTGTVTDSAGIQIVSNTDQGIWTEESRWTVVEDLRIGSQEGDPNYEFGQIGWITVSPDGTIYATDLQAGHVRAFTPDGRYTLTIGSPGEGPGEIRQGVFVLRSVNDTLLVPDLGNLRVNRFELDGSSAGSFPIDPAKGVPVVWRSTNTGQIVYQVRSIPLPGPDGAPGTVPTDTMDAIIQVLADGSVADTLIRFPAGGTFGGGGQIYLYSQEPVWTVDDSLKIMYGVNDQYRFGIYAPEGTLERVVAKSFEKKSVGERDKEAVMNFLMSQLPPGVPSEVVQQIRSTVHFGEFFPAFNAIQVGPNGTMWVQHIQAASDLSEEELEDYNLLEESGAADWDVFDQEGRYLGIVTMPPKFAPRLFLGNNIYGVWRDELDVQYVMRLRIVGP